MSLPEKGDVLVDTLGTYCPVPILRTARAVVSMARGQILELLSDDRGVLADLPDWCTGHGHLYLGHRPAGRAYRLFMRKG